MRSSLASAILAEAEGKRALSDEERESLVSDVSAALVAFRHDAASEADEELARRQRVVDGLDDAIAAMSMALDEPPFPSESRATAALRDGTFPAMLGAVGALVAVRATAAAKVQDVAELPKTLRRSLFEPLEASRMDGPVKALVLHAAASWSLYVDPALGLSSAGPNPLTRFLDVVLAEVLGDERPSISTVHDFMKKHGRAEVKRARGTWTFQAA